MSRRGRLACDGNMTLDDRKLGEERRISEEACAEKQNDYADV